MSREEGLVADISALIDKHEHSVRIVFEGYPETLFIKALRGETSVVSVEAVAMSVGGEYPLCLVTLDESANHSMQFSTRTRVDAPGCAFYANSDAPSRGSYPGQFNARGRARLRNWRDRDQRRLHSSAHRETDCPPSLIRCAAVHSQSRGRASWMGATVSVTAAFSIRELFAA